MINLKSVKQLYGNAYVQIPNDIFRKISNSIGNENVDVRQISFAYSYVLVSSFLYKYTKYIDFDSKTYVQNSDIKELLGYSKKTKTVDYIIKKDGLLDLIGITETTKQIPLTSYYDESNISDIKIRKFLYNNSTENNEYYNEYKTIVKNRNYEIKKPLFFFNNNGDIGTLYDYSNTHKITIDELLYFLDSSNLDVTDLTIYSFIKSKCNNLNKNSYCISLSETKKDLLISNDTFYRKIKILKELSLINVKRNNSYYSIDGKDDCHEPNTYKFLGL